MVLSIRFELHVLCCRLGVLAVPALLLACAAPPTSPGPGPGVAAKDWTAVAPPPGHELHETVLCGAERRKGPNGMGPPDKTFTVPLRMFVPKARCLELSAGGLLRVTPGHFSALPPKVTSCN